MTTTTAPASARAARAAARDAARDAARAAEVAKYADEIREAIRLGDRTRADYDGTLAAYQQLGPAAYVTTGLIVAALAEVDAETA